MTTQSQVNAYNSTLFSADGAQSVKIGKTVYSVESTRVATMENHCSIVEIKKGNTIKYLVPCTEAHGWLLYSGRMGLPKLVAPEFF
jgi:hypothetical protein